MSKVKEVAETLSQISAAGEAKPGKYLTFCLAEEEYGLEILKVRELIGLMEITYVPKTPDHIRGVINLRGKIIPVVDLRTRFGMNSQKATEKTCIIVVEVVNHGSSVLMGILVDSVSEVLDIKEDQIERAPTFGSGVNTNYILGIGKIKDAIKILLDIDKVLSDEDMSLFNNNSLVEEELQEVATA